MTVSVNEDPGVTSPQLVAALAVFRSIDQTPKEAVKLFLPHTKTILDYCIKSACKDTTTSIWQHRWTSIKSCEMDTGGKTLVEIPESEKIKIPEKVSRAAYKDAFNVAYETAFRVARETNSRTPLSYGTIKRLDELSLKTRQATFKSSYIAAFAAAVAAENQWDIDPTPTKLTIHKEASKISLAVTFRAAAAVTRAASRHAVRLVALGTALGHESAADAAADALCKIAQEKVRGPMASNDVVKEIDTAVEETRKGARNAFRQRFTMSAINPNSNIAIAAEISELSTAIGIYMAAKRAMEQAKDMHDPNTRKMIEAVEKILSGSTQHRSSSLQSYLVSLVRNQIISVPRLFGPSVDVRSSWKTDVAGKDKDQKNERAQRSEVDPKMVRAGKYQEAREDKGVWKSEGNLKMDGTGKDEGAQRDEGIQKCEGAREDEGDLKIDEGKGEGERDQKKQPKKAFHSTWRKLHIAGLLLFSTSAGALYSLLHLTKWNGPWFPTDAEHRLWQISCVVGFTSIVPIELLFSIPYIGKGFFRYLLIVLCSISWAVFIAARWFIIIESFLSLRALPHDAFTTVQWSNAIPHI